MKKAAFLNYIEHLDKATKNNFWELFEPKNFRKNEFFIRQGQLNKNLGYIEKGVSRSYMINDREEEITLGLGVDGDFIAGGFAADEKSNYFVEIIEDTEMLVGDMRKVLYFIDNESNLKEFAYKLADTYFKKKQERLLKINFTSATERYHFFLNDYPGLINRIPHFYIANFLGITPTQLSRIRKSLK